MEREVRAELTRQAEEPAFNIFAANLRNLLLQPVFIKDPLSVVAVGQVVQVRVLKVDMQRHRDQLSMRGVQH